MVNWPLVDPLVVLWSSNMTIAFPNAVGSSMTVTLAAAV